MISCLGNNLEFDDSCAKMAICNNSFRIRYQPIGFWMNYSINTKSHFHLNSLILTPQSRQGHTETLDKINNKQ